MPQDISGTQVLLDPSHDSDENHLPPDVEMMPKPVQVESFADRLMDDLFADVEQLLDGSTLPPEPVRQVAAPKVPSLNVTPIPQNSEIVPRPNLPQWNTRSQAKNRLAISRKSAQKSRKIRRAYPRRIQNFLTFALCASAIAASTAWLTNRGTLQRLFTVVTQHPPVIASAAVVKTPHPPNNQQFAEYLKRSIIAIDRKLAAGKPVAGLPTVPYNSSLPLLPIPGNSAATKSGTALPKAPVIINVPPAPIAAATPVNDTSKQELNQVLTRLSSVLDKLSPSLNRSPQMVQAAPVTQAKSATVAEPQRILRGIAIANDPTQSAILLEMNGVTQRYYVGESIGSSGWSVVDISSNYVSVRRNGDVRSISIGQKL